MTLEWLRNFACVTGYIAVLLWAAVLHRQFATNREPSRVNLKPVAIPKTPIPEVIESFVPEPKSKQIREAPSSGFMTCPKPSAQVRCEGLCYKYTCTRFEWDSDTKVCRLFVNEKELSFSLN